MGDVRIHPLPGSTSDGRGTRLHPGPLVLVVLLLAALAATLGAYVASDAPAPAPVEPGVRVAAVGQAQLPVGASGTGLGLAYDRAVARLVATNQRLEERQAALALAELAGSDAPTIAGLLQDVTALERMYVRAVRALATARAGR